MNFISILIVFTVVWWLAFFSLLPLGLKKENNPRPGNDLGAPATHRLALKFIITTLIAFILTICIYWGVDNNWISLWS